MKYFIALCLVLLLSFSLVFPLGQAKVSGNAKLSGKVTLSPAEVAPPSLPAFSNVVAAYSVSGNYNPVGYSVGAGFNAGGDNASLDGLFTSDAPYPIDYDVWFNGNGADPPGNPPFSLFTWYDQNGSTNTFGPSAHPPTLQITTSVIVSGAGTSAANGTYTYRGQFNGQAYYNLFGQPNSTVNSAITYGGGFSQRSNPRSPMDCTAHCFTSTIALAFSRSR